MKPLIRLILLALICASPVMGQQSQPGDSIEWLGVSGEVASFEELKVSIRNNGDAPIYLNQDWIDSLARLERYNEASGAWEFGFWPWRCGLTPISKGGPIEIKPKENRRIDVLWDTSVREVEGRGYFITAMSGEGRRPLKGRYKIVLMYALEPWHLVKRPAYTYYMEPGHKYFAVSGEFVLR